MPTRPPVDSRLGVARRRPRPTLRQGGTYNENCQHPKGGLPQEELCYIYCWLIVIVIVILIVILIAQSTARHNLSPNLGRQCNWAELHETGGLSVTLGQSIGWDVVMQPGLGLPLGVEGGGGLCVCLSIYSAGACVCAPPPLPMLWIIKRAAFCDQFLPALFFLCSVSPSGVDY